MVRRLGVTAWLSEHAPRDDLHPRACRLAPVPPTGETPMQWQTPTAVDFRFGFEITMYVAAR